MVWHIVSDSHKVKTVLILALPSNCCCGGCIIYSFTDFLWCAWAQAEFASSAVEFLHRVGRTARAGRPGKVTSLFTDSNRHLVNAVREAVTTASPVVQFWNSIAWQLAFCIIVMSGSILQYQAKYHFSFSFFELLNWKQTHSSTFRFRIFSTVYSPKCHLTGRSI